MWLFNLNSGVAIPINFTSGFGFTDILFTILLHLLTANLSRTSFGNSPCDEIDWIHLTKLLEN